MSIKLGTAIERIGIVLAGLCAVVSLIAFGVVTSLKAETFIFSFKVVFGALIGIAISLLIAAIGKLLCKKGGRT